MRRTVLLLSALLTAAIALPAHAVRLDIGLGTLLRNSGISTGVNYRFGGLYDRLGTYIHLDPARLLQKKKKGKEVERVRENVRLRVTPKNAQVYLNGVRVDEDGRSELMLPPGKHRLEFVRSGHRTEVAEVDVQPGVDYEVERKLAKLQRGENGDLRAEAPMPAVSVEDALRARGQVRTEEPKPAPGDADAPGPGDPRPGGPDRP